MTDYDLLFCVVLRIQDDGLCDIREMVEDYSINLCDGISSIYPNCFITPVAIEVVEKEEDSLNVLNDFEYMGDKENRI